MAKSIEEKVEEYYKQILDKQKITHYAKTQAINQDIKHALEISISKSGGSGNNFPDIQLYLEDKTGKGIPVMIEAKGQKGKLEKLDKENNIVGATVYETNSASHKKGENNFSAIENFAVNGALHYGKAVLDYSDYEDVIIIGINGSKLDENNNVEDPEYKAYYVSNKNNKIPKELTQLDSNFELFNKRNRKQLFDILNKLNLSEEEIDELKFKAEITLEKKIKKIHQSLYEDKKLKTLLETNQKLYLFCGLIMAGLKTKGLKVLEPKDLPCNDDEKTNDGSLLLSRINSFLTKKGCSKDKIDMILQMLSPVFLRKEIWKPHNGESIIKSLYREIYVDIIPCLEGNLHLDFTGKILNSLNDWVSIENDKKNDVVLTPRYVTTFMANLCRTDMNSFVWDRAMGSGGFLVSAMDIMIKDAQRRITDEKKLKDKIESIKTTQLLGVEILGNIYILAVLNMILMGDGSTNMYCEDSHKLKLKKKFPATVFLLNPPYSALGKGFNFVEETLRLMPKGYAAILIQENAGSGQGLEYTKNILKRNTLIASIHMPTDLFGSKSSVQTAIYVFEVAKAHNKNNLVTFIDFSNDGYSRQNRKKSSQEVNLKDVDDAKGRYKEVENIILNKKSNTSYFTEKNGLVIKDTITLEGNDWVFNQHKKLNIIPNEDDFKNIIKKDIAYEVEKALKENF